MTLPGLILVLLPRSHLRQAFLERVAATFNRDASVSTRSESAGRWVALNNMGQQCPPRRWRVLRNYATRQADVTGDASRSILCWPVSAQQCLEGSLFSQCLRVCFNAFLILGYIHANKGGKCYLPWGQWTHVVFATRRFLI